MSQRGHQTSTANAQRPVSAIEPTSIAVSSASSRTPSTLPTNGFAKHTNGAPPKAPPLEEENFSDFTSDIDEMGDRRPPLNRSMDGRSHQPLLQKDDEDRGRTGYNASEDPQDRPPMFTRRSTMRSRSPDTQAKLATKKKYTYAAFFLGLSLISFVIQTETAVYIQHELGWNKAYCML
jgi:hypothetical protein